MSEEINERAQDFVFRPLEGERPYFWLDATRDADKVVLHFLLHAGARRMEAFRLERQDVDCGTADSAAQGQLCVKREEGPRMHQQLCAQLPHRHSGYGIMRVYPESAQPAASGSAAPEQNFGFSLKFFHLFP